MFENILVPLDGSSCSEAALTYAVALAGRTGAKLTLVRAINVSSFARDRATAQREAIGEADTYLDAHAARLRSQDYVVETGVPYGSTAADWIVEETTLRHADLIVMATHDRVGPDRWLHGSVAEAVVGRATVPVVVVRAPGAVHPVEHFDWRQPVLIVPLDRSSLAEAAVPVAVDFARALNGRVILATVITEPSAYAASYGPAVSTTVGDPDQEEADARTYLKTIAEVLVSSGIPYALFVRFGDPAEEIAQITQEQNAAAIVMSSHGRTGLLRSVLGSVAGQLVHRSISPVVLVHPTDPLPRVSSPATGELAPAGA
jgi:nucleotide-binding universal stress UspA family protein